jgi:HAD domain in Swiss Army Knife RNA repair proteins
MATYEFKPFRGLPLTPEQDAEVRAYIARCISRGEPWDTLRLDYMLKDMLAPDIDEDCPMEYDEAAERLESQVDSLPGKRGADGNTLKICFLDYDGVVHVDAVYWNPKRGIYIGVPDHQLFEWTHFLEELLTPHPDVKIVLSTSWVRFRSFKFAKNQLSPSLQTKVIGATFHNRHMRKDEFDLMPRGLQVWNDVVRRQPTSWFAIDNDDKGWPERCRGRLVKTNDNLGLSDPVVQDSIRTILELL